MKRLLLLLAVTFCYAAILDARAGETNVLSRRPIMNVVRPSQLPQACGVRNAEACTAFVGQRLTCRCERIGAGWMIVAHAQFIPVMYVTNGEHLAHEREHIGDIETSLAIYLDALGKRKFPTSSECERTAAEEASRFTRTMDGFKLQSNELRHGTAITRPARRRSAPPHLLQQLQEHP